MTAPTAGLITTLLEMAFAGNCGIDVNLPSESVHSGDPLAALFSEEARAGRRISAGERGGDLRGPEQGRRAVLHDRQDRAGEAHQGQPGLEERARRGHARAARHLGRDEPSASICSSGIPDNIREERKNIYDRKGPRLCRSPSRRSRRRASVLDAQGQAEGRGDPGRGEQRRPRDGLGVRTSRASSPGT